MSENVGFSTSRNPKGLHGLYRENVTYFRYYFICSCTFLRYFFFLSYLLPFIQEEPFDAVGWHPRLITVHDWNAMQTDREQVLCLLLVIFGNRVLISIKSLEIVISRYNSRLEGHVIQRNNKRRCRENSIAQWPARISLQMHVILKPSFLLFAHHESTICFPSFANSGEPNYENWYHDKRVTYLISALFQYLQVHHHNPNKFTQRWNLWSVFRRYKFQSITMAARSKASTVAAHYNAGIMGSNPTRGMDVCAFYSLFVLFCE
jgi:hypothetical protein